MADAPRMLTAGEATDSRTPEPQSAATTQTTGWIVLYYAPRDRVPSMDEVRTDVSTDRV